MKIFRTKRVNNKELQEFEKSFLVQHCKHECQLLFVEIMKKKELIHFSESLNNVLSDAEILFNNSLNAFNSELFEKNNMNSLKEKFLEYYTGRINFVVVAAKNNLNNRNK